MSYPGEDVGRSDKPVVNTGESGGPAAPGRGAARRQLRRIFCQSNLSPACARAPGALPAAARSRRAPRAFFACLASVLTPGARAAGRWTPSEHERFVKGLELYGREWKKVASLIPSRTVVQIRTHAQKYFQKLAKEQGLDPRAEAAARRGRPRKEKIHQGSTGGTDRVAKRARVTGQHADASHLPSPPRVLLRHRSFQTEMVGGGAGAGGGEEYVSGEESAGSMSPPRRHSERRSSRRRGGSGSGGSGGFAVPGASPRASPRTTEPPTPRAIKAAFTLIDQRTKANLAAGRATPRTREAANWLSGVDPDGYSKFSWNAAAASIGGSAGGASAPAPQDGTAAPMVLTAAMPAPLSLDTSVTVPASGSAAESAAASTAGTATAQQVVMMPGGQQVMQIVMPQGGGQQVMYVMPNGQPVTMAPQQVGAWPEGSAGQVLVPVSSAQQAAAAAGSAPASATSDATAGAPAPASTGASAPASGAA